MKRLFTRWLLMTALMVMSITTAVAQKSVLDESFKDGSLPTGWKAGSFWKFNEGHAKFFAPIEGEVKDTLVSPMLNISSLDNKPSVAITYAITNSGSAVNELRILYRASQSAAWSQLVKFDAATSGQVNWKGELPGSLNNVQIAVEGAYKLGGATGVYRLAVENKTEATSVPTGLGYEDLTTSGVTLNWDACTSKKFEQYNLKVSSSQMSESDMMEEADVLDKVDENLTDQWYELSGLKANTDYWFYVQYDCGYGDVSPWAEGTFHTPCIRIAAPYSESFEEELSTCYTIIKGGSEAKVSGEYAYNSTQSFKSISGKGKYNYLILPEFSGDVKNYQVSFMAAAIESGNAYARTVTIGVCTDATAESFTEVKTLNLPKGHTWESIVVTLQNYKGAGKYIAFRFGNADKESRLFVDNIRIENATACPKPMFAEAYEITHTSAKLKWIEAGNASEWNLVLSTKPLSDPEDLLGKADASKGEYAGSTATNPHTAANLLPNTTYYAYVTAGCGSSEWTKAVEFKTSKEVSYPYFEDFSRMNPDQYTNDANAVPDGWVMDDRCVNRDYFWDLQYDTHLPYVTKAQNHEESAYVNASLLIRGTSKSSMAYYSSFAMLPAMPKAVNKMMVSFWAYSTSSDNTIMIGVANTQTADLPQGSQQDANIVKVDSVAITPANTWQKYNVSLKNYTGTGRYITFYCKPATSTPAIYIDDITIDDIPECDAVTGLTAEATGTNSISALWTDATSATSWKVKVSTTEIDPASADGNVANTTVTAKSYSKSGLSMGTTYHIYVSPVCGDMWEHTSATTAVGMEVPFYADFTGETTGYKADRGPKNWKLGNTYMATWTTSTYVPYLNTSSWTNKPADETTPYLYFTNSTTASTQFPYAIMPKLLNANVGDLQMSFYAYWNNNDPSNASSYACVKGEQYGPLKIGVVNNLDDIDNSKKFKNVTYVKSVYVKAAKAAQKVYVDLSSYTGSGKYIVFYQDTAKSNYMCIDNLRVARKSDPWPVTDLVISNITKTGAKLTWTENGAATKWEVRVFTSAQEDPAAGEPVWSNANLTSKQAAISGLTNSSQYYAYARSLQTSGEGEWGSISFWTACDKVSLPYVQDFNSFGHGSTSLNTLSPCFEVGNKNGGQPSSTYTGTTPYSYNYVKNGQATTSSTTATGPGTSYYYVDHTYGNDPTTNIFYMYAGKDKLAYLVLPEIDGDLANMTMQFFGCYSYAFTANGSSLGAVEVCIYNESDGSFTHVENYKLTKAKEWEEFNVNFPSTIHSGRIAFRINNTEDWRSEIGSTYASGSSRATFYMYLDDITVSEIPPCQKVLGVEVSKVDSVSATLTWPASGAEAWNLKVSTTELADPSAATADFFDGNVTSTTKTFTNLDADTKYYVYVQTSRPEVPCTGEWSVATSFQTWCKAVPFPYVQDFNDIPSSSRDLGCITQCGPDKDSYVSSGALWVRQITLGHNNYVVFPAMQVDSIKRLQLSALIKTGATTATNKYFFEIGIMTDPSNPNSFVATHTDSLYGSSEYWDKVYTFEGYKGDKTGTKFGKYIAIHPLDYKNSGGTSSAGSIYVEDVLIDYAETCVAPRSLQVPTSDVNSYDAKLIWETDDKTATHRVRLFTKANADPDNDAFAAEKTVNDSVIVIDGLNGNTVYYAYVRKECGPTEVSAWSRRSCSFRTQCAPIQAIPYEEGFESGTSSKAPDCWTSLTRSGSTSAKAQITTSADYVFSGAKAMSVNKYYSYNGSSATWGEGAAVSPKLDIESPKDLLIYFDIKSSTSTHNQASLLIEAVSDNTNEATSVEITTLADITNTWKKAYIVVKDYYTSEQPYQYIRFTPKCTATNSGTTMYIDNIVFTKDLNTILPVAGLEPKKVSTDSVTFAFVESTPGINAWQVAYVAAGGEIADATIMNVTETTVTINGLTPASSYDIYVRSEGTEWVGPLTMTTVQTPASLPYSTGFEDDADQWTMYNVQTVQGNFYPNFFIMGDAANCGGSGNKVLYITNDSVNYMSYGTNANMNPADYPWMSNVIATSYAWATRNIHIPYAGTFSFSFKLKQPGNATYDNDGAYVQLIPAGATYKAAAATMINGLGRNGNSTSDAIANNCYALLGKTRGVDDWTWFSRAVDITEPGIYTVAVYWANSSTGSAMAEPLAMDSILIEEYFCTVPSDVQYVERKSQEVTLRWNAGQCKNFEYVVSKYANLGNPALIDAGDKKAYGMLFDGPQVTISNLEPSTEYSFYVRTVCTDGNTAWLEYDFVTPCKAEDLPYTEAFFETPECWILTGATAASGNKGTDSDNSEKWNYLRMSPGNRAIMPEFNVPLNKIQVTLGLFNTSSTIGSIQLGVVDNTFDFSTFTPVATFAPVSTPGTTGTYNDWKLEEMDKMLNLYQGSGKVLALRNISGGTVGIKYITFTELPDCVQPQSLEIIYGSVTENSAKLSWTAGLETAWDIKINDVTIENVTDKPYTFTGLEESTMYTVSVRAICDSNHKSEWSTETSFQTICGVNSLPLTEEFSGLEKKKSAYLHCWDLMVCDQPIEQVAAKTASLIKKPAKMSYSYGWTANWLDALGNTTQLSSWDSYPDSYGATYQGYKYRWFISPRYAIEGQAVLSFDARKCNNVGDSAKSAKGRFFVAISLDNGETWKMEDTYELTNQLGPNYSTQSIPLDKYNGDTIRVALYHEGKSTGVGANSTFILIDNLRMNCSETYAYNGNACQGVDYEGYGFSISKTDIPALGKDSTYYRFAVNTANGCDSTIALTLTTYKPADVVDIDTTICEGDYYEFGGDKLTKPASEVYGEDHQYYYINGETEHGCEAKVRLFLTVSPADTTDVPVDILNNQLPYAIDEYYTIAKGTALGKDTVLVKKGNTCSFNRYFITISQCTAFTALEDSICAGEAYDKNEFVLPVDTMPAAGETKVFERHILTPQGCDSLVTLSLKVIKNDTTEIDTVAVWNKDLLHADYPVDEFFTIKKNTPVSAFDTVVWTVGCSYNLYHIAVKQCTRDAFYADTICANETSYVGYGFTLEAGQLPVPGNTKEFKNNDRTADECDSTTTLNLYVRPLVHNDKYITKLNTELPFTTEDGLFTIKAGTPVGLFDTVVYTNVGCDYNIYHVTIEQCEEEISLPLVTICENETSYKGFGFSINADEMPAVGSTKPYVRHAMNEAGCDSVITLRLKVLENDTTPMQVSIFNYELPYEVDDYYEVPADARIDTPFDTIVWTEGCAYNLYHVLVNRCTVQKKYNAEVCEGDEVYNGYGFSIEKAQWPATGTSKDFTNVTRTANQCDSTTTLTLTVIKADTNNIEVPIDNTMLPYTVDNYYEVPATTAVGADYYELVRIDGCAFNLYHVTVAQCEKPISYNETICEDADGYVGYGFSIEKADLPAPLASKEYVRHAMDNANCDSVITLTLTAHNDTTNVPVSILITKLPFEVDEWYTVPADAQVGEQFEVVKQKGTDCAYNRYIVMVSACGSQIEYKDTVCADQTSYDGFGFSIEAADMPAPGSFKSYYRNEPKGDGCDHITFTLTVMKNDTTNVPVTILNNELPFEVDAFYTVPENTPLGSFEKVVKLGDNGCSYNKYIVTINQCTASYNFADAVCESQTSYLDNGFSIEAADMPAPGSYKDYTRHELTAQGCDSTITLRLMVTKNDTTPVPVKILNNELPFEVDAYYTVPENTPLGSFEKVVKLGDEGCSYNKYMVTINQCTASSVFTDAICESQMSYDGYGFSIEKADMPAPGFSKNFIRHETTAQGCDSTITLKLEIIPNDTAKASVTKQNTELPFVVDEYFTILAGTPVGSFDTVVVKDGCSYKRYSVTIIQETKAYSEASAVCEDATGFEGFGFSIEAADMPAAGTSKNYTRHALNEAGVDSVITFTLSVIKNDTAFINDTVFNNELPYIAQGETIVAAGAAFGDQPTKVLANNGACSYTSYSIFVEQCTASFASVDSICAGSEYSGYGFQIALADMPAPGKSKLYERHETTLEGCDSLISLTLKVMKMDTTKYAMIEIKNNQLPYEIDRYYTVPEDTPLGIHEAVVVNPEKDCAFYRYRYNIVQCSEEYKFTDMICIGSDYEGYGFVVAKADKDTVLTRTSMGAGGCDSIITLTLTVELPDTNDIVKEVLNSELPFIAQNETIVAAGAPLGIQPEVILPAGNCAYNRYIITVTQCSNSFSYKGRVCDGEGYEGFGFILPADSMPAAGESKDFFRSNRSAAGCDSLITLTLTVSKLDTIDVEKTIQKNELPFIANGDTIIAAGAAVGVQPEVIKQGNGCMYNRYIITVIACEIYADLTDEACAGSDYKEYGFDIKASEMPVAGQSKEYTRTSKDAAGCDSIITLTLTVKGDTTYLDPIEINEDQLPYQVNEFITIPAGTPVGVYEEVIQIPGDCQFIAYTVTIHEQGFGIIHITDAVESIEIYDLLGHKITTIRSDEEAKSLPTGVYMLRSIMKSGQIVNSKAALK